MSDERWLPVVGWEGLYEVSDLGRVRSLARTDRMGRSYRGRMLKQREDRYAYVSLTDGPRRELHLVHRLVATAFLGSPTTDKPFVLHGKLGPLTNWVTNLRWGTHSENMLDSVADGTHNKASRKTCPQGHDRTPGVSNCRVCIRERARTRRSRGLSPGDPRHGTRNGAVNYGCQCVPCLEARRTYDERRADLYQFRN